LAALRLADQLVLNMSGEACRKCRFVAWRPPLLRTLIIREPQKIPLVMSPDETKRLLAVAHNLKVRVLLSLGYGCGLRAGEVNLHISGRERRLRLAYARIRAQSEAPSLWSLSAICRLVRG
jgi:hypothetical protein